MLPTERDARAQIVWYSHKVHAAGLVCATDGNLSVRLDDGQLLITPSGIRKEEMTEADPIVIDMEGEPINDSRRPSTEYKIHVEAYRRRPEIRAVIHAHPPIAVAYTLAEASLDTCMLPEIVVGLGRVPIAPYATPSTDALPQSMRELIRHSDVVMLARHGSVTVGTSLSEAFARLEKLERSAEILLAAHALGGAKPFSRDQLEELHGLRGFYGVSGAVVPCAEELDDGRQAPQDKSRPVRSIEWQDGRLILLDQTELPNRVVLEEQATVEQVWDSIKRLKVRGAPAIGVAAAYGLVVAMQNKAGLNRELFLAELRDAAVYLSSSRPTAVNLSWAVNRVVRFAERSQASSGAELLELVTGEASRIHEEDIELCRSIGIHGVSLIQDGVGILTHCNAGRLATSDYGTATAPMYLAHERGVSFSVYSDESRPLLQGSRLTAWELKQAGIDVYTITDNMAAAMMQQGLIHLVIVGTDRVAANGDVANKIGTLGVAILAKHFDIPFYVACPSSTVDLNTTTGRDIEIEGRDADEVTSFGARRTAPVGIKVRNPAFDVTPHELVTGFITDRGVVRPPYERALQELFGQ